MIEDKDPSFYEYLYVWDEEVYNWVGYRYYKDTDSWGNLSFANPMKDFRECVLYALGYDFNEDNIVSTTPEVITLSWGRSNPDDIKLSNNEYHVCLYHKYNGIATNWYHEMTSFLFDKSSSPIPHLDKLNF